MRVNVYAEEITTKVDLKKKDGRTGVRFWLYLPVTVDGKQVKGPFMHREGDDDSSAIVFWDPKRFRVALKKALKLIDRHLAAKPRKKRK